jgi:hypothetical protein
MDKIKHQEIIAMLTVLYKKLDKIERSMRGSTRMTSDQTYLNELRKEADKLNLKDE